MASLRRGPEPPIQNHLNQGPAYFIFAVGFRSGTLIALLVLLLGLLAFPFLFLVI